VGQHLAIRDLQITTSLSCNIAEDEVRCLLSSMGNLYCSCGFAYTSEISSAIAEIRGHLVVLRIRPALPPTAHDDHHQRGTATIDLHQETGLLYCLFASRKQCSKRCDAKDFRGDIKNLGQEALNEWSNEVSVPNIYREGAT
jgi:hypothetical protein